jgi:hypothetical protein
VDWAIAGNAATTAHGNAATAGNKETVFMESQETKLLSPPSPTVPERQAARLSRRTTTLLAGIRADRTTFITFPDNRHGPVVER